MGCPSTYYRFLKGNCQNVFSEAGGDVLLAKEAARLGISVAELRDRYIGNALEELKANLRAAELLEKGARALGISAQELSNMFQMRDSLITSFPPHLQNSGVALEIALFRMSPYIHAKANLNKTALHRADHYGKLDSNAQLQSRGVDTEEQSQYLGERHHIVTTSASARFLANTINQALEANGVSRAVSESSILPGVRNGLMAINISRYHHDQTFSKNTEATPDGSKTDFRGSNPHDQFKANNEAAGYNEFQYDQLSRGNGWGVWNFDAHSVLTAVGSEVVGALLACEAGLVQMENVLATRLSSDLFSVLSKLNSTEQARICSNGEDLQNLAHRLANDAVSAMGLNPASWSAEKQARFAERRGVQREVELTVRQIDALLDTGDLDTFRRLNDRLTELNERAHQLFREEQAALVDAAQ